MALAFNIHVLFWNGVWFRINFLNNNSRVKKFFFFLMKIFILKRVYECFSNLIMSTLIVIHTFTSSFLSITAVAHPLFYTIILLHKTFIKRRITMQVCSFYVDKLVFSIAYIAKIYFDRSYKFCNIQLPVQTCMKRTIVSCFVIISTRRQQHRHGEQQE